ncbi:hypothetical protein Cci01nite_82440 [Catellatospora citrea]|uniref:Uncharacterized protein n=1 Tax=Catellatospora citrea TaxID=53366 RepID=A0A8J3P3Z2_9ACTN|nr:hypothetical protein C8E86_3223 [Catellatospora citrea]GIG03151.1 hypothetical protein Cci01nite_82440 [Catellatospora citrea]
MDPSATLAMIGCAAASAVTLGYAGLCAVQPFARCERCQATGWRRTAVLRRRKDCRRCKMTGYRARRGVRVYNHLRRLSREVR